MPLSDYADPRELLRLTRAAADKASEQRERLNGLWNDLQSLSELVAAWAKQEYTVVPWRTIGTAVGALVYFINPMDAMPDLIPGLGYLDDGAVLAFVAGSLRADIEAFEQWREARPLNARKIN